MHSEQKDAQPNILLNREGIWAVPHCKLSILVWIAPKFSSRILIPTFCTDCGTCALRGPSAALATGFCFLLECYNSIGQFHRLPAASVAFVIFSNKASLPLGKRTPDTATHSTHDSTEQHTQSSTFFVIINSTLKSYLEHLQHGEKWEEPRKDPLERMTNRRDRSIPKLPDETLALCRNAP